jgi:predicted DCC family thiol-disulfide oxidoreductase YuxK
MNATTAEKGVVLFDGSCPFCRKSVGIIRKLDWFGRLEYRDATVPENWPATAEPLQMDRLMDEMHLVTPRGATHAGFFAFRWMSWRLPLTWLVAPLLYVPGVSWLGSKVYLWIARNRYNLVPCHDGQCAVPRPKSSPPRSPLGR